MATRATFASRPRRLRDKRPVFHAPESPLSSKPSRYDLRMPKRSKSSARWLAEHANDEFVKRAQREGWRSRAVFKLAEIQESERLLKPGIRCVDLGAAPGGWSQYAARIVGGTSRIVATDILPMDAIPGVDFVQGDFREQSVLEQVMAHIGAAKVDLVLSDMAPNMAGIDAVDQPRSMYLAE